MSRRTLEVEGEMWTATLSGRVTSYSRDEVGVLFELGSGARAIRRLCRFRPMVTQRMDAALSELSDVKLRELWRASQPAWTSPELGYGGRSPI